MKDSKGASMLACVALALSPSLLAQAPMDDALWVASRGSTTLTKYSRFGEVLQTVDMTSNNFTLRGVFRAPDGKLWVVNFITQTFTICDRNGKVIKNVTTNSGGSPYAIAFDKRGYAYITETSTVAEYKPDGTLARSFTVPSAALGIAVDYSTPAQAGNVWVAHRNGPPGQISKIDIATGTVTTYTLPTTSTMLPTTIVATYEGIAKASNIWVGGDRSTNLYKLDQSGTVSGPYAMPNGYLYTSGMAIDAKNRLWAVGRAGVCAVVDTSNGNTLKTMSVAPLNNDCGGVVMDSIGRPWIMDRGFSTPCTFQRYDDQGVLELQTPDGVNTYGMIDASGFSYAYVTNPFGDEDGDGAVNFTEITNGTSPYDALSTPALSFDTRGVSRVGNTPYLDAVSTATAPMVAIFSAKTGTPIKVPGMNGEFLLDLPTVFFTTAFQSPGKLNLPIPANNALAGISYQLQGLLVAGTPTFSNLSGIYISP
ncbi:MAG: hypothetical protein KDC95_04040 [Planctomycetes bacterium]|nr:hypothetical protein [Planctomycetota bacterium]